MESIQRYEVFLSKRSSYLELLLKLDVLGIIKKLRVNFTKSGKNPLNILVKESIFNKVASYLPLTSFIKEILHSYFSNILVIF